MYRCPQKIDDKHATVIKEMMVPKNVTKKGYYRSGLYYLMNIEQIL